MSYDQLFRLDARRAVVVGAGSGIGREAARAFAAHGAVDVLVFTAATNVAKRLLD